MRQRGMVVDASMPPIIPVDTAPTDIPQPPSCPMHNCRIPEHQHNNWRLGGMDTRNGQLYQSMEEARAAGVPDEHLVGITGTQAQADDLSKLVKEARLAEVEKAERKALAGDQSHFRKHGM